jgi:hypothetical protein
MRPNARQLAMRDPALAALMGALPGTDFGSEGGSDFAGDFYGDFGDEMSGDTLYGADYGGDFGMFGAAAAAPAAAPAHHGMNPQMIALWKKHQAVQKHTMHRVGLLKPNGSSLVKVEGYSFSINQTIAALGVAQALLLTGNPQVDIRPIRVTMNAPSVGFATIADIKVSNVSATVGTTGDAFKYSILGVGAHMKLPMLTPAIPATVTGNYTGFLPPGFVGGTPYLFEACFEGPAILAGGSH